MLKALIFDMDGTIVDNIPFHHEAWLNFLKKYNIPIAPEGFAAQNHGTADEMMIRFFGDGLTPEQLRGYGLEKEQTYRDLYQHSVKEITGFTALLKLAKEKGLKIGLATMGNTDNIDFVLGALKVKDYFDVIVDGNQVKHGKPHPEVYQIAVDQLGFLPAEVLAFEDSLGGVRSAQAAGIPVIGVGTAHSRTEFSEWGVDRFINNFEEYINLYW